MNSFFAERFDTRNSRGANKDIFVTVGAIKAKCTG